MPISVFLKQAQKGYLTMIGAVLLNLIFGSLYLWGILNLYVGSYFHSLDPNFSPDKSIIIFPFLTFCLHLCAPFSFKVCKFLGFRLHLSVCVFMVSCSLFFSLDISNFWGFFLFYGVLFGSSAGLVILVTLFNAYKYFPLRKGLITGIILGSFGSSAMFSSLFLMHFLNPNNVPPIQDKITDHYYFPNEISRNLPNSLKILAGFYILIGSIGILLSFEHDEHAEVKIEEKTNLIKVNQSDYKKEEVNNKEEKIEKAIVQMDKNKGNAIELSIDADINKSDKNIENEGNSLKDALKSRLFSCLLVMLILSTSNGFFLAVNFKNLGIKTIQDDNFLNYVGSVGAVANGAGRVIWGLIYDRFQFKASFFALLTMQIIEAVSLRAVLGYEWLYLIWVGVSFFCLGGHSVLFPAFCVKAYGEKEGPQVYGFLIWGGFLGNLLQTGVVLWMKEVVQLENMPFLFAFMSFLCWILALIFKLKPNK